MTCSQFFLIARPSDAFTSTRARNCCPFDCPPLPPNPVDPELSAIQWLIEERLLAIYEAEEEQQAYEQDAMQYMYQF